MVNLFIVKYSIHVELSEVVVDDVDANLFEVVSTKILKTEIVEDANRKWRAPGKEGGIGYVRMDLIRWISFNC